MRADVKTSGFDELQRKLAQLPAAMSMRVQVNALKAGAEPIRAAAAALAPRDEEAGAPHLADNIIVAVPSAARREAQGVFDGAVVEVGPSAPFFYGFFQEIGTAFHPAKPFMRPAFDSNVRRSLRIVGIEAWTAIRRFVSGGGVATGGRGL